MKQNGQIVQYSGKWLLRYYIDVMDSTGAVRRKRKAEVIVPVGGPYETKEQVREHPRVVEILTGAGGSAEERFWAKVNKNGPVPEKNPELGPCWLYTGTIKKSGHHRGYGQFSYAVEPGKYRQVEGAFIFL